MRALRVRVVILSFSLATAVCRRAPCREPTQYSHRPVVPRGPTSLNSSPGARAKAPHLHNVNHGTPAGKSIAVLGV